MTLIARRHQTSPTWAKSERRLTRFPNSEKIGR